MRQPTGEPSIGVALGSARRRLAATSDGPALREAALLLAHVLTVDEVTVLAHTERPLAPGEVEAFDHLLERRLSGEPFAYLTGAREFYGRRFQVDRRVLIPRPETEHLVEAVLERDLPDGARMLDIGTGSGCLALTLALERPAWGVTATDRSVAALAVAASNRRLLGAEGRVRLVAADLAGALRLGRFDLVVANPPYIAPHERAGLQREIRLFEPDLALYAPTDAPGDPAPPVRAETLGGTSVTRRLLRQLAGLSAGAVVALEVGRGQAEEISLAAVELGFRVLDVRRRRARSTRRPDPRAGREGAASRASPDCAARRPLPGACRERSCCRRRRSAGRPRADPDALPAVAAPGRGDR